MINEKACSDQECLEGGKPNQFEGDLYLGGLNPSESQRVSKKEGTIGGWRGANYVKKNNLPFFRREVELEVSAQHKDDAWFERTGWFPLYLLFLKNHEPRAVLNSCLCFAYCSTPIYQILTFCRHIFWKGICEILRDVRPRFICSLLIDGAHIFFVHSSCL